MTEYDTLHLATADVERLAGELRSLLALLEGLTRIGPAPGRKPWSTSRRKAGRPRLGAPPRAELLALLTKGLTFGQVGQHTGVSRATSTRWCRDIPVDPRATRLHGAFRGRVAVTQEMQAEYRRLLGEGVPFARITAKLGCSPALAKRTVFNTTACTQAEYEAAKAAYEASL